jgi:hypothetical protein
VKWYPDAPARLAPCLSVTLGATPDVLNHGLPERVARAGAAPVLAWVAANRPALLDSWNNGESWTRERVNRFAEGLKKLP